MANYFLNTDQTRTTASTPVQILANYDSLAVGPDAVLATTGTNSHVVSAGENTKIHIAGDLFAVASSSNGIIGGVSTDIRVTADGSIMAGDNGISLTGSSHQLSNAGSIQAEDYAFVSVGSATIANAGLISGGGALSLDGALSLTNTGEIRSVGHLDGGWWNGETITAIGSSYIMNSGTIASAQGSVIRIGLDDGQTLTLFNTGLISAGSGSGNAGGYTAIGALGGTASITNAGTILGNIFFDGGHDRYDGTSGLHTGGLYGDAGDDTLLGGSFGETIFGGIGDDEISGGGGQDSLDGGTGHDTIDAGEGNDAVLGGAGFDVMDGGLGFDTLSYAGSIAAVVVNLGTGDASGGAAEGDSFSNFEALRGSSHSDTLMGSTGDDFLQGGIGNDSLVGSAGSDRLYGQDGIDLLFGGGGGDVLRGGTGADTFRYTGTTDSTVAAKGRDRVLDFNQAEFDQVNLFTMDANTALGGNQAFAFVGAAAFSNTAGELRYTAGAASTLLEGDVNGDGAADFATLFAGNIAFTAADFVL